ncbi:hypothetical protein [Trichlorobacter ammonificans]|uniref:Uncharacterized protein n=1 Tax=Trichlorobacter ammonificans TaxID=2916410 RepID=A0ABM9D6M2_9BACT|nr:hypothetical protein [Trichlorobacter ammonificans]CAH2030043.1 conserved protein of unknown function [Trichlorobacter ammonificans]
MAPPLFLERFGPVAGLPVLHYRLEFACLVRQAVRELRPDAIALELPATLGEPFRRALSRLPRISLISHPTDGGTAHLLVEPADPLAEAGRLALEANLPLYCIDLDLDSYPQHRDRLPDPYSITRIGPQAYYRAWCDAAADDAPCPEDLRRERAMAHQLQQLAQRHQRILFVCGMVHLQRVREQFFLPQAAALGRRQRDGVTVWNLHPDCCGEVLGEFPFLSAVYEYCRGPLPPVPEEKGNRLRTRFHALELIAGGREELPEERLMDNAIRRTAHQVCRADGLLDRQRIIYRLFNEAARHYRQETGDRLQPWQKRTFFRFVRNYALQEGMLQPDLYQLLVAARGCVDDNFAYALCRLAMSYPWQQESSDLATRSISAEELWGGRRLIRFRPRDKRRKGLGGLRRSREKRAGEWLEGFDTPAICSYPPEDLAIEAFGSFLKKKGSLLLSEELSRSEKFTTSLLDGIDLRETVRAVHEQAIYVREQVRAKGGVGSVVVIFDEDRDNRHPYCMTWLGEHDQESDMAFYAGDPAENVVGPGICRCEYGGFMLSYPPRRMQDVWQDPDYRFAESKAEVLLLAALDYSPERYVVYAAARPPRSIFRQQAARIGRTIIYLPLGSLSPVRLKKLRVLHILAGHDKRGIAKDYIW